jgi:hypothetical protein
MSRKPKSRSGDSAVKPPVIELAATEVTEPEQPAAETPAPADDETAAPAPDETPDEAAGDAAVPPAEPDQTAGDDVVAPPQPPHRGRLVAGAIVLGLIVAAAGGALFYREYGTQLFPSTQASAAMQALEARLAGLEAAQAATASDAQALGATARAATDGLARVSAELAGLADGLKALKSEVQARAGAVAGLQGRLDDLEAGAGRAASDIAGLKTALATAAKMGTASEDTGAVSALQIGEMSGNLDALGQRVKAVEDGLGAARDAIAGLSSKLEELASRGSGLSPDSKAARLAAAFAALEARIGQGKPFGGEVDALAGLDPNLPGLEALRGLAATGVPSAGELTRQLGAALAKISAADSATTEPVADGWMAAFKSRFFSVVRIRKIGEVDWPAAGAAAEAALQRGDLDAAIAALGPANAAVPEPIANWLASAAARKEALARLAALSVAVFQSIKRDAS